MNRIYFNFADKEAIGAWLSSQPAGAWRVLIGTEDQNSPVADAVAAVAVACGQETVQWVVEKMGQDELVVRVSKRLDLPVGVPLKETR